MTQRTSNRHVLGISTISNEGHGMNTTECLDLSLKIHMRLILFNSLDIEPIRPELRYSGGVVGNVKYEAFYDSSAKSKTLQEKIESSSASL